MATDFDLLDAWRRGARAAADRLLRRHFDSIYCFFFNNKIDSGFEDLIKRTFLACVKSKDQFRGQSSFRTDLFTVARNELYRHFKRSRRERDASDLTTMSVLDLETTPTRKIARHKEQLSLEALRTIPVDLQICIELHYWEEFSTAELALVLRIPQGTAKSRLRRASEALEASMAELVGQGSPLHQSTMMNFDRWAQSIRRCALPGRR